MAGLGPVLFGIFGYGSSTITSNTCGLLNNANYEPLLQLYFCKIFTHLLELASKRALKVAVLTGTTFISKLLELTCHVNFAFTFF